MKRLSWTLAGILTLTGCGSAAIDSAQGTSPVSLTVTVIPSSATVAVGATQQYSFKAVTVGGTAPGTDVTSDATVGWQTSASAVATITSLGLATCQSVGATTITGTAQASGAHDNATGSATGSLTCSQTVARVKVDSNPPPLVKAIGAAASQLPAAATDASGNAVANATFVWTIQNPAIATVTSGGLMTPVSPGQTLVTATATGTTVSGTSPLYILGNGSCSATPTSGIRSMTISVKTDPGSHASAIGLTSGSVNWSWSTFQGAAYLIATAGFGSTSPWPRVDGGWVAPTDCVFAANGTMTVGSQQNVGVRVDGTWSNGTLTLTLTVGTNGELSGGATVYNVSG